VFERSLLDSSSLRRTMPLAYLLELAMVGSLVLAPLINTRALTGNELRAIWSTILPPPPPPGPSPGERPSPHTSAQHRISIPHTLQVPPVVPTFVGTVIDLSSPPPQAEIGVPGGLDFGPAGRTDGVIGGLLAGTIPPPPAHAAIRTREPIRIRQGGKVVAAKAIYQPAPDYPQLAQITHVQGIVRLEAVIATDGTIQDLRALSGHPWLVGAATAAVSRWRYQPTLLNGEAVEVVTEIDVTFKLAE
jgi:protein TonB